MPNPSKPSLPSDLLAGVAAVLALLLLVFALHAPFLLGLLVAAAVYAGTTLLARRPADDPPPGPSVPDMLTEMTALSQKIAAHAIRLRIGEVVAQARTLMNYLQQTDDGATWQDYVRDVLTSAVAGTRRFATLSAYLTDPDDAAVVKFSDFLATLSQTLDSINKKLVGDERADFASQMDTYKNTLQDINQVYLGGGKSP